MSNPSSASQGEKLPKRPAALFSLHARPDDYRVTFFRGWLTKSSEEQDAALEDVFSWMRELVQTDRGFRP